MTLDEERYAVCYRLPDKFYDYNIGLMQKLKNTLSACENYYTEQSLKTDDNELALFFNGCTK